MSWGIGNSLPGLEFDFTKPVAILGIDSPLDKGDTISMTSPTTIKNRVSILVNGVTRLANEVFGSDLPVHAHHRHTELDHDDHLQYMLCSAGPSRPFTGVVYFETGLALRGEVELTFDDHYRTHSAYPTPGIPLSLSAAEWTAFIANYGNASIIGAFNKARNPYTAGTAINITNHVVTNTGVISLCKLGQTPSGGAWSLVEGVNITITQDTVNKRLTINGQAGGGAYDDSAVFYHSGSRPGTGNWTLYDGSDYHGIGGLVYLRGQADNQTSAFQQVSFTASDGILIEDRIVGSEPDPDRESSITLNQNEAISGAAILVAKLKDADGVLTFGADQSGVYWHDRILRGSTDWGAGNPFLLADIVEETNPYDDLYAALGDQRLPLVNILALLAANGGAKLEENAVGYGSSDGLLTGDVDLVSFDPATGLFKVGSGTPEVVSAGLFLDEGLEVTGASSLIGGAWVPLLSSLGLGGTQASPNASIAWDVRVSPSVEERLLISSSDKIRFTDAGGSLLLSSGVEADYTTLAANYSLRNIVSILNSIGISADGGAAKHGAIEFESGANLLITPLITGNGYRFDTLLGEVRHVAANVTTSPGTPSGTVNDTYILGDETTSEYTIHETDTTPGFTTTFEFQGLTGGFRLIELRGLYTGSGVDHHVDVELWSYDTSAWLSYGEISLGNAYSVYAFSVPNSDQHISGGVALLRFNHPQTGNASHYFHIDYLCLVTSAVSAPTVTLQTAYNAGSTIALDNAKGPVAIRGTDPYNNYNLTLSNTLASRTAPLMHITNNSTSEAPAIDFSGSAGDERDYGHRIWSSDDGGVLVLGRGYKNRDFASETLVKFSDRITNPYTHIQDAELIARSTKSEKEAYFRATIAPIDSTPSGYSGSVAIGADDAINILSGGDIDISATDSVNVENARSVSYGSAPTSITYGTTIAANFETGNAFQSCTATGNITTVTLTPPLGVQSCQLMVFASGGARSITGFSGSVSWGEPIDPDVVGYTIPSGEWAIFWLYWNGSAWFGTVIPKFS